MRGDSNLNAVHEVVARRGNVLSLLLDRTYTKQELTSRIDVSRSTVDRAVRQLEANGLVTRTAGGVVATRAGKLAYDAYDDYCDEMAHISKMGDLLAELPPAANVGHDLLMGATAYRSEPPATGRPVNEVMGLLANGNALRCCAMVINDPTAADELHRLVTERGGEASVVYTSRLADHIREHYFEVAHEMASTGRYHAYEIDDLLYDLFLVDTDDGAEVVVLIYGDGGTVRGAIRNDTEAAVDWGERTFERLRASATVFTDEFKMGGVGDEPVRERGE